MFTGLGTALRLFTPKTHPLPFRLCPLPLCVFALIRSESHVRPRRTVTVSVSNTY
jgi:hypothetical protein